MARYGIVSDIHGNLEALAAAAAFLEERGVDRILCLGDIVGYNADSDACVAAVLGLSMECVAGNHDRIAVGAMGWERCSDKAAFALRRTRRTLGELSRRALAALPERRIVDDELLLFHGGYLDVSEYMTDAALVEGNAARVQRAHPRVRICLFGHTHVPRLYEVRRGKAAQIAPGEEILLEGGDRMYFINPGSIDAARRPGARRSELAIYDASRGAISFHSVPYDHEAAERRAMEGGFRRSPADQRLRDAARALRRGASTLRRLLT